MATKKIQILTGEILQSGSMIHTTLDASNWSGEGPYFQDIVLNNIAANNKIDIQTDANTINEINGKFGLCIKNNNGAVTAYAIGDMPDIDLNVQLVITSVKKHTPDDVVWGNILR